MQSHQLRRPLRKSKTTIDQQSLLGARIRCYQMIKKELQNSHHKGYSSDQVVDVLKDMIDVCLEDPSKPLWLLDCLSQVSVSLPTLSFWVSFIDTFIIGYFAKKYVIDGMFNLYDLLYCLINSLKNVQSHKSKLLLSQPLINSIFSELEIELRKLEEHMFNLCDMFPSLVTSLQSKQAAKVLLNDRKNFLETCFENGVLTESEFHKRRKEVDTKIKYLTIKDFDYEIQNFSDLQFATPIFRHVRDWVGLEETLANLLTNGPREKFQMNDVILEPDRPVLGVYIVAKGRAQQIIEIQDKVYETNLSYGAVIDFGNVVGQKTLSRSQVIATANNTELVFLEINSLNKLLDSAKNQTFEEEVFKQAMSSLLRSQPTFAEFVLDDDVILNILSEAQILRLSEDVNRSFSQTPFLMSGAVRDRNGGEKMNAPCLLEMGKVYRFVTAKSAVLLIPQPLEVYVKENFRFKSDNAVHAMSKMSMGRVSGFMKNSFVQNVQRARNDGEFVNNVFSDVRKRIRKLKKQKK